MDLIRVTPDKEKAKSILRMVETTEKMILTLDIDRFPSNIIKEYYDVIRELLSILLLLDGYRAYGEGAHKTQIEYLREKYKEFSQYEIDFIDELRGLRNRISYDGYFLEKDYLIRKSADIKNIIHKLKKVIESKLS